METPRFEVNTRTQYTFKVSNEELVCLTNLNVKKENNPHAINIVGMSVMRIKDKKQNLVKMIVGTDAPHNPSRGGAGNPLNPDLARTNELQNQQFQENLKALGIKFEEDIVIQIFN